MPGESIAYFEGQFMPLKAAKISIVDPAVTKSDIVFDVVSATGRTFFRLDDHLDRFETSCRSIRIKLPVGRDELKRISAECIDRSGYEDACVFMCGTRGQYRGGVALGDPRDCENGFYVYAVPYYWVVPRDKAESGAHLWIAETRRAPDEAINQKAKNFNRMDLTKATFEALDHGADAAVLLSMQGQLSEGAGFNIWIVRGKTLLTPGENLLEGITRRTVFDLARDLGLETKATNLPPEALLEAPEAFLSTTAGGIIPVTRVNDRPLGNGAPGLQTSAIRQRYWEKRRAGWHGTTVNSLLKH
ncbi:MAG: branched-chain amino acid--2-keto-4-methylthiobutyrate aminotransferase [Alphaproteobacteria bacterium]|nr:branched-chain amino acid--2-keto-4-methylthiobutyrate aminotransferase [Alphaproteobacteria bacterium]